MSRVDFEQLADDYLDGSLSGSEWEKLIAEHGETLQDAVKRAEARRDALRSLPRPPMPARVHAGINAAIATRGQAAAPQRWSWRALFPVAVAAGLVYAISLTHQATYQSPPERQERAKVAEPAEPPVPRAPAALALEDTEASKDISARNELAAKPMASAPTAPPPQAAAQALAKEDQNAGAPAEADGLADLKREARQFRSAQAPAAIAEAEGLAPGPLALSLAMAKAMDEVKATAQKKAKLRLDTSEPTIEITLANRTVTELTIQPNQLTLRGLDASGTPVWTAPITTANPIRVPAGQTVRYQQVLSGALAPPAAATQLVVSFGSDRSAPMPLAGRN